MDPAASHQIPKEKQKQPWRPADDWGSHPPAREAQLPRAREAQLPRAREAQPARSQRVRQAAEPPWRKLLAPSFPQLPDYVAPYSDVASQNDAQNEDNASGLLLGEGPPTAVSDILIKEDFSPANDNPVHILTCTRSFNKIPMNYYFSKDVPSCGRVQVVCTVYILGKLLGKGKGIYKKLARRAAAAHALATLRSQCNTIFIKQTSVDTVKDNFISRQQMTQELCAEDILSANIGAEKNAQENLRVLVRKTLRNYIQSDDQKDLVFSPEFSKEERALMHRVAEKFNLESKSYGSGEDRFLVLSRYRSRSQLYQHIVNCGGETFRYKLIPPQGNS